MATTIVRSACVLNKPLPHGLSSNVSGAFTSPAGRGLRITAVRRITLARIGSMSFGIHVSDTADVASGKVLESEVVLEAAVEENLAKDEDFEAYDDDDFSVFEATSLPSILGRRLSRMSTSTRRRNLGSVSGRSSFVGASLSRTFSRTLSRTISRTLSRTTSMLQRPGSRVLASFVSRNGSAFSQLGAQAPQQLHTISQPPTLQHMVGVVALLQHIAHSGWQAALSKKASDDVAAAVAAAEAAAAAAVRAAAEALSSGVKPADGSTAVPGPSMVKLMWEGIVGGMVSGDIAKMIDLASAWTQRYGPVVESRFFKQKLLFITDPTLLQQVLGSKAGEGLPRSSVFHELDKFTSKVHGCSTVTSLETDAEWQRTKRSIAKAVAVAPLREDVMPVAIAKAQTVVDGLAPAAGIPMDPAAMVNAFIIDVAGRALFKLETAESEEFAEKVAAQAAAAGKGGISFLTTMATMVKAATRDGFEKQVAAHPFRMMEETSGLFQLFLDAWHKLSGHESAVPQFLDTVERIVDDIIAAGAPEKHDTTAAAELMRHYLAGRLSKDRVMAEVAVLMLVGTDTTGNTLQAVLRCLAEQPQWQDAIVRELEEAGFLRNGQANPGRELTLESVTDKLPVLEACIKEAMRVMPGLGVGTLRQPREDVTIGNFKVEKGTQVWVPFWSLFRNEQVFTRGSEYLPERWLATDASGSTQPANTCPVTSSSSSSSSGCPFLRAQGLSAAPASGSLASAMAELAGAFSAAAGVERFGGSGGGAVPDVGAFADQSMKPSMGGNHQHGFIPFGIGSRSCPGRALAMLEVRVFLIKLLSQYKVALADPSSATPVKDLTMDGLRRTAKLVFTPHTAT